MLLHIFNLHEHKNVVVSLEDFLKQNTFEVYDDDQESDECTYSICLSAYKDDSCEQVFWVTFKTYLEAVQFVNELLAYLNNTVQDFQVPNVSVRLRKFDFNASEKPTSLPAHMCGNHLTYGSY